MQGILAVTFPFFALVLLGYVAVRRRMLPDSAIPGLNGFVLFFALPCMLFRFGASRPLSELFAPAVFLVWGGAALAVVALTIAVTVRRRIGGGGVTMKDAAFGALVAAFPNSGFLGFPLLLGLLGSGAASPIVAALLFDIVVTSSLCLALSQFRPPTETATRHPLLPTLGRAMKGALLNPLPWAIVLGAASQALGLLLPRPVDDILRMLGDAATPVALFTIGAVLWRAQQQVHTRTPVGQILPVAAIKLLLRPLLVLGLGWAARASGAELSPLAITVLVLTAALPSASNVSLLAERHGADNGRITRIIMASTALSFVTLSTAAWLLGGPR